MVTVAQRLRALLAGRVWLHGMVAVSRLGGRDRRLRSVHAGGGSQDEFGDVVPAAKLEQVERPRQVGLHERPRVLHALPYPRTAPPG